MQHEMIDRILTSIILLIRNYFLINIYHFNIHTRIYEIHDYSGSGHNGLCSRQAAAADYPRFNISARVQKVHMLRRIQFKVTKIKVNQLTRQAKLWPKVSK